MAKAKKETLVCRPCGNVVLVSDLGEAVIECYECGTTFLPVEKAAAGKKAAPAKPKPKAKPKAKAKKAAPRKAKAKKTAKRR